MLLRFNTPYMINRDGVAFECDYVHPYILYEVGAKFKTNLEDLSNRTEWIDWFYAHTNDNVRADIVKCLQMLADGFGEYANAFGLDAEQEDLFYPLFKKYKIELTHPEEIPVNYMYTVKSAWEELNKKCNDLFMRVRSGGMYNNGRESTLYFRICSDDFNWFDTIWEICYENKGRFETVTIVADHQSGKYTSKEFYVLDGNVMDSFPMNDFLTLSGNPIVEKYERNLTESTQIRERNTIRKALKESSSKSLKGKEIYMMDRTGRVYEIDFGFHPYIYQDINDEFKYNLYGMFNDYPVQLHWIKDNCTSGKVMALFNKSMQMLANAVKNASDEELKETYDLDKSDSEWILQCLAELGFDGEQVNADYDYLLDTANTLAELNDAVNDYYLRIRLGGIYNSDGQAGDAYFRISSEGFNWFNLIWKLVYDNRDYIKFVTVVRDNQSGKGIGYDDYYTIGGKDVYQMPVDEFLTLKGNPILESAEEEEGEEKIEVTEAEDVLDALKINGSGEYSDDDTYTVTLRDSNDYGRVSSILDNSDLVEPIEESSYLTAENGNLDYKFGDNFIISLIADFDNDYYQMVITNMGV